VTNKRTSSSAAKEKEQKFPFLKRSTSSRANLSKSRFAKESSENTHQGAAYNQKIISKSSIPAVIHGRDNIENVEDNGQEYRVPEDGDPSDYMKEMA